MKKILLLISLLLSAYYFLNRYLFVQDFLSIYIHPSQTGEAALFIRFCGATFWGLVVYAVMWSFRKFVLVPLQELSATTKTRWDDWVVEVIRYSLDRGGIFAVIFTLAHLSRPWPGDGFFFETIAPILLGVLALLILTDAIGFLFLRVLPTTIRDQHIVGQVFPLIRRLAVVILWVIGMILVLDMVGVEVTALLAGAGIGGLAIALAAQKPLANFFGAISLIINKPFRVGDFVRVDDNTMGNVKEIGLTYTTLIDRSGQLVHLSNEFLGSAKIENFKTREKMRGEAVIGVTYDMTSKQLHKGVDLIRSIFEEFAEAGRIQDNWHVSFESFGDFSQNIAFFYYDTTGIFPDFKKTEEEINFRIKEDFEKAKIAFAFPTQEVILKK